jgi:hypothetical protein
MPEPTPELWTITQVAAYLGIKPPSARGQLSRWGVRRYDATDSPSGRIQARYLADDVRSAAASRLGAGHRSDLRRHTRSGEPGTGDTAAD